MRRRAKQIWVTDEEKDIFQKIQAQCDSADMPLSVVKGGWAKTPEGTVAWKNPGFSEAKELDYFEIRDELVQSMQDAAPVYPTLEREFTWQDNMGMLSLADLHLNKLCEVNVSGKEYNLEIGRQRIEEGMGNLLGMSQGFGIEQYLLVIGNDILNSDTPTNTTTGGTPQDNDKHWTTAYQVAKSVLIYAVEALVQYGDVHIVHCPSNHDYQLSFCLADGVVSWFNNHPNVTSDVTIRHRKYYEYGLNMLMLDHGDKSKASDAPGIMAEEMAAMWGRTKHRYSYKAHVHHKDVKVYQKVKEYPGVTVEHLGSPSPADEWHDQKGYIGGEAMEMFLHNKERGRFGHFTYRF